MNITGSIKNLFRSNLLPRINLLIIIYFITTYFFPHILFSQYQIRIANGQIISENLYEFDVLIESTDKDFVLTSYQCALSCKSTNKDYENLSFNYIDGSSDLINYPTYSIGIKKENETLKFCFAAGASYKGFDIINDQLKKIGRFRIQDTDTDFVKNLDLIWNFSGNIRTLLTDKNFSDITTKNNFFTLNDSLLLSNIPEIDINEDDSVKINLNYLNKFIQNLSNPFKYMMYDFEPGKFILVKYEDSVLTLKSFPNWYGRDSIFITVSDGINKVREKILVSVIPVNDPPVLFKIGNQKTASNLTKHMIVTYTDVDSSDNYKIMVKSDNPNITIANISGDTSGSSYDLIPSLRWFGNANITVKVTDSGTDSLSDSETYVLTVEKTEYPPVILQLPTLSFNNGNSLKIDKSFFYPYIETAVSDSILIFKFEPGKFIKADWMDPILNLTNAPNWVGTDSLKMTISDGSYEVKAAIYVTVKPVPGIPYFISKDTIKVVSNSPTTINFWQMVDDLDTPDSLLIFKYHFDSDFLTGLYDSLNGNLTINPPEYLFGIFKLYITIQNLTNGICNDTLFIKVNKNNSTTLVREELSPSDYCIFQNFPNPFNPSTVIKYGVPLLSHVQIEVYDAVGKLVKELINEVKEKGYYEQYFNAGNYSSGIYFYTIRCKAIDSNQGYNRVMKMILIK